MVQIDVQAKNIIQIVGGHKPVAKICGVDLAYVYRWTYPKERRGTNGLIPVRFHKPLISGAKEMGIDLVPNDFFYSNGKELKNGTN